jgi:hypothetical protein
VNPQKRRIVQIFSFIFLCGLATCHFGATDFGAWYGSKGIPTPKEAGLANLRFRSARGFG